MLAVGSPDQGRAAAVLVELHEEEAHARCVATRAAAAVVEAQMLAVRRVAAGLLGSGRSSASAADRYLRQAWEASS